MKTVFLLFSTQEIVGESKVMLPVKMLEAQYDPSSPLKFKEMKQSEARPFLDYFKITIRHSLANANLAFRLTEQYKYLIPRKKLSKKKVEQTETEILQQTVKDLLSRLDQQPTKMDRLLLNSYKLFQGENLKIIGKAITNITGTFLGPKEVFHVHILMTLEELTFFLDKLYQTGKPLETFLQVRPNF